jgi:hypothetical protein
MSASRLERNRDAVAAELAVLRALVRGDDPGPALRAQAAAREALGGPSSLDELADGFGLTAFERAVLLLAAGPELVGGVADDLGADHLTFSAALSALPDGHWSAITPPGPLRRWGLVDLADPAAPARSPLLVDERILHHIAGSGHLDARVAAAARPVPPVAWLPATLTTAADQVAAAWRADRPVVLHGPQPGNLRAVFAAAAGRLGLGGYELAGDDLPAAAGQREAFLRRLERETVLIGCAWLVDGDHAAAGLNAPVAVLAAGAADAVDVHVPRLEIAERRDMLASLLRRAGAAVPRAATDAAAGVFDLPLPAVEDVARDVADGAGLWSSCRAHTRARFDPLATVIEPRATWDDLVLPPVQLDQLRALAGSVRHRATVLDDWGFGRRTSRGLGAAALFTGPSGTGKTMAAEVLANELELDLVQVDLSQVVSKYIGETEKHLREVFDAAESGGCVLLFDEADALFGRRTEVRDSHDRYANIEVNYLLQRMEAYRGLAILTTNARAALDPAFVRRLRVIVTFPYPDAALRRRIWEGAFPAGAPASGIDPQRFSSIDVPGGGIAAIALTAAYLAAQEGADVHDGHVLTAARWELAKSGRSGGRP